MGELVDGIERGREWRQGGGEGGEAIFIINILNSLVMPQTEIFFKKNYFIFFVFLSALSQCNSARSTCLLITLHWFSTFEKSLVLCSDTKIHLILFVVLRAVDRIWKLLSLLRQ